MEHTAAWHFPLPADYIDPHEDFVAAAAHCEQLALTAQDTENMMTQRELYRQLNECLSQLLPVLNDPIPQGSRDAFIVDTLPAVPPNLDCDSDLLCDYCLALSELLAEGRMPLSIEETLQALLSDLIRLLAETIAAPRWLRTPDGLQPVA